MAGLLAVLYGIGAYGVQLEERDLIRMFGDRYRRYRQQVAMLLPMPGRPFVDREDSQS